jgi:hypothetical protein
MAQLLHQQTFQMHAAFVKNICSYAVQILFERIQQKCTRTNFKRSSLRFPSFRCTNDSMSGFHLEMNKVILEGWPLLTTQFGPDIFWHVCNTDRTGNSFCRTVSYTLKITDISVSVNCFIIVYKNVRTHYIENV